MLKYKIPQIVTLTHKIPQIVTLTQGNEKGAKQKLNSFIFTSRGDWIRTSDHTPPRRVL